MAEATDARGLPDGSPSDMGLVERAVRNAIAVTKRPRWVAVQDLFGTGSTTSRALCRRFALDPEEIIANKPRPPR